MFTISTPFMFTPPFAAGGGPPHPHLFRAFGDEWPLLDVHDIHTMFVPSSLSQLVENRHISIDGAGGRKKGLLNLMMQLRKCCNHPYLFLEEVRSRVAKGHSSCKSCVER